MLIKLNEDQLNKKTPDQSTYLMYGDITMDKSEDFTKWVLDANSLLEDRPEVLNLIINSPGGDLNVAFSIIDFIRGSHIPVRTIGTGQIASAGLMIFISGKSGFRSLTKNTSIMSHTWSWGHFGKSHELIAATKEYDLTSERMMAHYKKCTKLSEKQINKYLLPKQDVYLSAEEAKEFGICDVITDLK